MTVNLTVASDSCSDRAEIAAEREMLDDVYTELGRALRIGQPTHFSSRHQLKERFESNIAAEVEGSRESPQNFCLCPLIVRHLSAVPQSKQGDRALKT